MSFQFSPDESARIRELVGRYADPAAAIMPALELAQQRHGLVSMEVVEAVAAALEVPLATVLSSATFYTMYNKKPVGRFHIQVCHNIACYLKGGEDILAHLMERLGIAAGETTPDGRFTLSEVECLAACGTAPSMQINETYYKELSVEKVDIILAQLKDDRTKGDNTSG